MLPTKSKSIDDSPANHCRNSECKTDIDGLKNPLAGLRFHDLRHSSITMLAEGNASEQTIRSIAGHLPTRMLEQYSHIRKEAKRRALAALCARNADTDPVVTVVKVNDPAPPMAQITSQNVLEAGGSNPN